MGFYLRKSVSAGPFRFNLSKSGLGVSAGVKGLRVGAGPRGTYVHMGAGGLSYRTSLSGPRRSATGTRRRAATIMTPSTQVVQELPAVTVLDLEFGTATDLVQDLNAASHRFPLSPAAWLKGQLRVPVIYDVNGIAAQAFDSLNRAFDGIRGTHGRWLIDAQAALTSPYARKVNAGAASLVTRQPVAPVNNGPKWLATNIAVPGLKTKKFSLYFLPDQILVQSGRQFASWKYCEVTTSVAPRRFIEDRAVPPDAVQVDHTWQYANKNGGPDRRYKNNRMLPVLQYAELEITGPGLTLRWQFSNLPAAQYFAQQLAAMPTIAPEIETTIDTGETPRPQHVEPAASPTAVAQGSPPPAGWYPDPGHIARRRWWDGHAWTEYTG
ncbi:MULTISPECIES: DUF4236 domain-containing protein [Nocardia]|uniref:DUF4236 domain-containing protein n=1 Tax=Nocardia TaxID=1817 RepID=UPI000A59401A|nr:MULTISPECIES: DUF4236 domain-containing protein [Nocardia]